MPSPAGGRSERLALASLAVVAVVYVLVRVTFLLAREPFFDELFTCWIAALPYRQIVRALQSDSGPPLYYALVHSLAPSLPPSVVFARVVSLVSALGAAGAILAVRSARETRLLALLLLSLYPAHLYFSTEARAYALCGAAVGIGCVLARRWCDDETRIQWLVGSLGAFLVAACAHYYGALFLPLPFVVALASRRRVGVAFLWSVVAACCYLPVLLLFRQQPSMAIAWIAPLRAPQVAASILHELSMAADYPRAFLPPTSMLLQAAGVLALLATVVVGLLRSAAARWWVAVVAGYAALAVILTAAGRPLYFPMRFEAVVAVPLVLLLAESLVTIRPWPRRAVISVMLLLSLLNWGRALSAFVAGVSDPYRDVSLAARQTIPQKSTIVASGYAWLEIVGRHDTRWSPPLIALPAEQALHPGWRAVVPGPRLDAEVSRLAAVHDRFFWVGESDSPELSALSKSYLFKPLYRRGSVILAIAVRRPDGETSG